MRLTEVVIKRQDKLLQIINAKLRIEQVLSDMESVHSNWLRQDMFHRQRASLELEFVTDELISRHQLLRILTADRRAGFSSPTVNWYFENIRVSPTSRTEHQLIFRVRLSLTDSVSYKRYYIWSWPIPGNSSNHNVQIPTAADVATHTLTGGIFHSTACLTFCANNPERRQNLRNGTFAPRQV